MVSINLYPHRDKYYESKLAEIENHEKLTIRNKELLKKFGNNLLSRGTTGKYTVAKRWSQLVFIAVWLGLDFDKASKEDLEVLIVKINNTSKSEETKSDYRRSLKQFYDWYEDIDERLINNSFKVRETTKKIYKYLKKDVSLVCKKRKIDPEEVINDADLKQILKKGCNNIQEKAIFSLVHETGARLGEVFSTKIKNFKVNERGIGEIFFPVSKTEQRTVHIIDSVPFLLEHLQNHPKKEDKNFPLFYYVKKIKRNKKIIESYNHSRIYNLFKKIIQNSGINKRFNPHWFRHSRASLDSSSTLPVDVRCSRMGWSIGSKQLKNYTHISNTQVKNAWLREKCIEEEKPELDRFVTCSCKRVINSSYNHCPHCGRPNSIEVIEKEKREADELLKKKDQFLEMIPNINNLEEQKQFIETLKLISKIVSDPKLMKEFSQFKDCLN
jgi:integrase/recombinase XerD